MAYFFDFDDGSLPGIEASANRTEFSAGRKEMEQFKIRLHEEILRSQRRKYPLTLMRVAIVPTEGEYAVAAGLADKLKETIREYDVLCSIRSDEYLIAFPETEERHAEVIAGRIRQTVEEKSWADSVDAAFEATIGIACFPQDGTNADDLMESAEHDLRISRKLHR